jgi:hypothetical protein
MAFRASFPLVFFWDGTDIVVCTAPTAPKVAALNARPNVALTIDTAGAPAEALLVRGVARIEVVDGVPREYSAAAAKSTHGDELAQFEAHVRGLYAQMARIAIPPTWARHCHFGEGRLPTFLRPWSTPRPRVAPHTCAVVSERAASSSCAIVDHSPLTG